MVRSQDSQWTGDGVVEVTVSEPLTSFQLLNFVMTQTCFRILLLSICVGCSPASSHQERSSAVAETKTPGWDEQIAAVRSGASKKILLKSPVTSEMFLELATGCEHLVRLEANVLQIEGSVLKQILSQLPDLQQLVLTGTIGNDVFTAAATLSKLKILNLPEASFDDAGLTVIKDHPSLELLRIETPNVTDAGLQEIAQISNLRYLHLIRVPITDAGLKHLYSLKKLESFYLDRGECTEAGLSGMIKALPKLHFHWDQLHLHDDPNSHSHD